MSEIKWSDPTHFTDKHALSMTLRDYFAAKAMRVFINNPETEWADDVRDAYDVADKMLKERNKE